MKYALVVAAVVLGLWSVPGQADQKKLDKIASCSGVVIGNAALDYALGDERAFDEATDLAMSAFLGYALGHEHGQEDLQFADRIMLVNIDKIVQADSNQVWDSTVYEEIVDCYRLVATTVYANINDIKANQAKIRNATHNLSTRLKRVIDHTWN